VNGRKLCECVPCLSRDGDCRIACHVVRSCVSVYAYTPRGNDVLFGDGNRERTDARTPG
jgi:hypothetical protein